MLSPIITLVECLKPGYNPGEISPISPSTAPSDARCSGCSCHVSSPHRVSRGRICWRIRLQRSWRQSTSNDWRKVGSTVHRRNQMRKFWDLYISDTIDYSEVQWYRSYLVVLGDTGFFKKNSHPQETTEIPCLPPQPPTSMLWSEVPSIINRNGCFFWRPPNTKFRRQHWIGGRGVAWPLWCGTSWDGCFFWRTRTQKRHSRMDPWLQTNARMMTTLCQRKHRDQFGRVFVCGCRICANMGCAKWNTCSDSLDTFLTWFRNVVGCTGCRSAWQARHFESVTALSCTPAMQRTCNTHATHMQHTCNTTCNMSFLPVNLQSTCKIWRLQPQLRS